MLGPVWIMAERIMPALEETTAVALYSKLLVDTDPLHTAANIARAEELLAIGRQQSRTRWQAWALSMLPRYHACLGDIAQAELLFGELADLAEQTNDLFAAHQASFGQLLGPTIEGDYDAAEIAAEQVRTAGERALIDSTAPALAYWGAIGMLRLLQGRWHELNISSTMSWSQPTMNALFQASIAAGRASENDVEGTREALSRVDPMSLADLPREMYWTSLIAMLAAACWRADDTTRAAVLYEIAGAPFRNVRHQPRLHIPRRDAPPPRIARRDAEPGRCRLTSEHGGKSPSSYRCTRLGSALGGGIG
jgi:hypothetical protein